MNYLEKLKLLMTQHGLNENQLAKKSQCTAEYHKFLIPEK